MIKSALRIVVLLGLVTLSLRAQTPVLVPQAGHSSSVNAVAFSADGKTLASGSDDRTILLWDLETGAQLRAFTGHAAAVMSVLISPKGKTVASMSSDGTVIVWDLKSGERLCSVVGNYLGSNPISFSPDGQTLAYTGYGDKTQKVAGSAVRSAAVYVLDIQTGNPSRLSDEFFSHSLPIAFSPDGKIIACVENDTLRLLDVTGRQKSKSLTLGIAGSFSTYVKAREENYPAGMPDYMKKGTKITYAALDATSIAFKADSTKVIIGATGSGSSKLQGAQALTVVDVATNRRDVAAVRRLRLTANTGVVPRFTALSSKNILATAEDFLAFSSDGGLLAAGRKSSQICLSAIASDEKPLVLKQDFSGGLGISRRGGKNVFLAPTGKLFVAGKDDTSIELWDTKTGTKLRSLTAEARVVSAIAFSPNGRFVASTSGENSIALYDTTDGRYVQAFTLQSGGETAITISKSNFSEEQSGVLDIRQILGKDKDGKPIRVLKVKDDYVESDIPPDDPLRAIIGTVTRDIEISPDSGMLASGGDDQIIRVWDLRTGKRIHTLTGHTNIISSVVFAPDSRTLASAGDDKTIKLWNTASGTLLRTLTEKSLGHILTIAFSPDGRTLASGDDNNLVTLWDVATGAELLRLTGSTRDVYYVSFRPDGKALISASIDNTVNEWDVSSGAQVQSFKGRVADNKRAVMRPDGKVLAVGRDDGRIAILSAVTNEVLGYLIPLTGNDWLTITPDGLFDGTSRAWGKIIWRSAQNTVDFVPVEAFFSEFYYPGLLTDVMTGKHPVAPRSFADLDRRQPNVKLASTVVADTSDPRAISIRIDVTEADRDEEHSQGSGAQDVRLFRNGSLVKVWHGSVLKGQRNVTLEATISIVAGVNKLTAYAFNHDNIKSADTTLAVTGADSLKRKGIAYVLAIGVNEYVNSQYNLKYAVADARDFVEELKRQQARLNNYERVELISLNDKYATKVNILKSLADLSGKVEPEDALVIFFAGHGTAHQNRFYLIPHDLGYTGSRTELNSGALQEIISHSFSDEEISRAVEGIDAGQMLLVIDACNSGQALEAEEKRRGPMNSKGLAQLAYEKGMYILTAAQSYQAANEAERYGHGFLTYALVEEGLKTNAADREPRDGQVLLREWLDFATERVPQMQQDELDQQKKEGRQLDRIKFAETDSGNERNLQRPRVFYRRETELHPLVIAKPLEVSIPVHY